MIIILCLSPADNNGKCIAVLRWGAVWFGLAFVPRPGREIADDAPPPIAPPDIIIINRRGKVERRNPTIAHVASPWMRQA